MNRRPVPSARMQQQREISARDSYDRSSPSPAYGYQGNPNVSSLYPGMSTETSRRSPQQQYTSARQRAQRIVPKHEPVGYVDGEEEEELSPDEGALQFVPAYEESSHGTKQSTRSATPWDAITAEEKKESTEMSCLPRKPMVTRSHVKSNRRSEDGSSLSAASEAAARKAGRMGRIASLFSSRAVVRSDSREATSPMGRQPGQRLMPAIVSPPSPAHSSGSSGYVGWPGTQDRRGETVAVQSSYDDSSTGGQNPPVLTAKQKYERELQEAAQREMSRWTGNRRASLDDYSSSPSSYSRSPAPSAEKAFRDLRNRSGQTRSTSSTSSPMESEEGSHSESNRSPSRHAGQPSSLSIHNLFPDGEGQAPPNDIWGTDSNSNPSMSSPGTSSYSRTSSAYFQAKDVKRQLAYPDFDETQNAAGRYGSANRRSELGNRSASPMPPTEESLASNDHLTPPHRPFPSKGYRGLIEKTKEVPSLMDAMDSDSMASSKATSTYSSALGSYTGASEARSLRGHRDADADADSDVFDGLSVSKDSDVFDNLSNADGRFSSPRKNKQRMSYPERIAEGDDEDAGGDGQDFKLVLLGGGLTAIQTSPSGFTNRQTASDYDENLTNSDVDQYGFAKTPGLNAMLSSGTTRDSSLRGINGNIGRGRRLQPPPCGLSQDELTTSESGSSLFTDPYDNDRLSVYGDLSEYYIPASRMKKVLRMYRRLSERVDTDLSLAEFERDEDEHKAFALFEMRSRIMEKDIDRGLERCGGTLVVDDLVTTQYNRTAHRIRDAVIVAKAWRDGASPMDVINSALLTCRDERTYYIKRPIRADTSVLSDNVSTYSGYSTSSQRFYWEPVSWLDDTDFMLHRCPSLGPRQMRGFEMFTIGDCQSILLKLTNERCLSLRQELNEATRRQIEAEDLLSDETDMGEGIMTEAEMAYLTAMEDVKTISKMLVSAEQSFALVRDRIEKLVRRYEQLLSKIEAESFAGASSIVTFESSYYSEQDSELWEDRERAIWARRAQRAEVKAELAAREAVMARREARMIQEEKQREVEALQQKLIELQSESSFVTAEHEHSAALARNLSIPRPAIESPVSNPAEHSDKQRLDNVKQRFRDRIAARKMQRHSTPPASSPSSTGKRYHMSPQTLTPSPAKSSAMRDFVLSAGEEMYQQLDFYERSLRAVESTRS